MPSATVVNEIAIERTPRVMQLEGLFDLPPASRSQRRWTVDLPIDSRAWNVGVIVGPSGSGKTSIARTFFPRELKRTIAWPSDRSIVDAFPRKMPLGDIASLLNAVGFSSPPSWLRPYRCLSTGEQFRVDLARRIADHIQSRKTGLTQSRKDAKSCRVGTAHHNFSDSQGGPEAACRLRQPATAIVGAPGSQADLLSGVRSNKRANQICSPSDCATDEMLPSRAFGTWTTSESCPADIRPGQPNASTSFATSRLCVTPSSNLDDACNPIVIDEFTSSLDRTVAHLGSVSVARAVRAHSIQLIAISCHEDVIDWLDPNWIYRADADSFSWRSLQGHPRIDLAISPAPRSMWNLFRPHHYLTSALSPSAQCYVGMVHGRPAVFTAVIHFPHPTNPGWREHRTVCLPDFQGVGLGNAQSDLVAGIYRATGKPYRSVTSAPAMIRHRARSPNWFMTRKPSRVESAHRATTMKRRSAHERMTASFEYVGPPRVKEAQKLGII